MPLHPMEVPVTLRARNRRSMEILASHDFIAPASLFGWREIARALIRERISIEMSVLLEFLNNSLARRSDGLELM
jgi:hypothetical protein